MIRTTPLYYVINHVFLPPRLPQNSDNDNASSHENDLALKTCLLAALKSYQLYVAERDCSLWLPCIKMIETMIDLRSDRGVLLADQLEKAIGSMECGGKNRETFAVTNMRANRFYHVYLDILPLHIQCQNAGIIIRRRAHDYSFESFELSATSEAVMKAKGRLRRRFPGPAIAVSQDRMKDASLREPLADTLAKMDAETSDSACSMVMKANSKVPEVRDTVHPRFITEWLNGILRAIGQPLDIKRIWKRTRDDVLWKDAYKPWRRSPLWLLLRVALQTTTAQDDLAYSYMPYKSFMIFFEAYILDLATQASLPSDILFTMTTKISRRVLKLGEVNDSRWHWFVYEKVRFTQDKLSETWNILERNPDPLSTQLRWNPSGLLPACDISLSLSTLQP